MSNRILVERLEKRKHVLEEELRDIDRTLLVIDKYRDIVLSERKYEGYTAKKAILELLKDDLDKDWKSGEIAKTLEDNGKKVRNISADLSKLVKENKINKHTPEHGHLFLYSHRRLNHE